ncbi:MAG: hypothetical protein NW241_15375 [Bacteroidia bacterium]|nr:hypothetical protein [Bacteroidia bacterium]
MTYRPSFSRLTSLCVLLVCILPQICAQGAIAPDTLVITGARFTYPLIEACITAFRNEHPEIAVRIKRRGLRDPEDADIVINAHKLGKTEIQPGWEYRNFARYVLLPATNARSEFAKEFAQKGLNNKQLRSLFFEEDLNSKYAADAQPVILPKHTLYKRAQYAGSTVILAQQFGSEVSEVKGIGVAGEDWHLVLAIQADTNGVTYNNPGYLFDLKTRQPLAGIQIIPVDLDGNGWVEKEERIYDHLDRVLDQLEQTESKNVPCAFLNLGYARRSANPAVTVFVDWFFRNSPGFLRAYGFLSTGEKS